MPTAAPPDHPSAGPRIRPGQIVITPGGHYALVRKVDGRVAFLRSVTADDRLTVIEDVPGVADEARQDAPPPVPPDGLEARDRAGHHLPIALVLFVVASIPATLTAIAIAKALGFLP